MGPPLKRRRVDYNDADKELKYRRARNDQLLKSRFESIFEKYGKDFSHVGDEIDLQTGEIVVDNGHILSMRDERDTGDQSDELGEQFGALGASSANKFVGGDDTVRSSAEQGKNNFTGSALENAFDNERPKDDDNDSLLGDIQELERPLRDIRLSKTTSNDPGFISSRIRWSSGSPPQHHIPAYRGRHCEIDNLAIDPKWRAPYVPGLTSRTRHESPLDGKSDSIENRRQRSQSPLGQSLWAPSRSSRCSGGRRRWTMEEEILLRHLKNNTTLEYNEMQSHFSGRPSNTIRAHWEKMRIAKGRARERKKRVRWSKAEDELLCHLKTSTTLSVEDMMVKFPGRSRRGITAHWLNISKIRTQTDVSTYEGTKRAILARRPSLRAEDFLESSQAKSPPIGPGVEQLLNEPTLQSHSMQETLGECGPTAKVVNHSFETNPTDALRHPPNDSSAFTPKDPKVPNVMVRRQPQTPKTSKLVPSAKKTHKPMQLQSPAESADEINLPQLPSYRLSSEHRRSSSKSHVTSLTPQNRQLMTRIGILDKPRPKKRKRNPYSLTPTSLINLNLSSRASPDILSSPSFRPSTRPLPEASTSPSNTNPRTLNRGRSLTTLHSRIPSSSPDMLLQNSETRRSSKISPTLPSALPIRPVKQVKSSPLLKKQPQILASTTSKNTRSSRQDLLMDKAHRPPISRDIPRSEAPQSRVKLLPKKRRTRSASFASAILGSSHGDLSDDELSLPFSTVSALAREKPQTVTKTGSPNRQCGSAGFRCERSVCLRCI